MEDVLDVYRRPYDPDRPAICPGEMSRQLLKHVQDPVEPEPGTPRRLGYHYQRNGTVNLFTFLSRWRPTEWHVRELAERWSTGPNVPTRF